MPAQWLTKTSPIAGRASTTMQQYLRHLAQPAQASRLRKILLVLLSVWIVIALARLIWALFPQPALTPLPADIINPLSESTADAEVADVNINEMMGWHLFGEVGATTPVTAEPEQAVVGTGERDGIEDGARETRLNLTLRGVVASTEDGLGHAIIEYQSQQDVYAVEDQLPVAGKVILAKVMPRQVVLDNGGTFELLTLFDESPFDSQLQNPQKPAATPATPARQPRPARPTAQVQTDTDAATLARGYREQLYENPQSLAELVRISAVREEGELRGYRIAPGKDRAQFAHLGFQSGDLVTGVNGIVLDDPANTMRLYQAMRTATDAVFEVERGGERVSVHVSLSDSTPDQ